MMIFMAISKFQSSRLLAVPYLQRSRQAVPVSRERVLKLNGKDMLQRKKREDNEMLRGLARI